MYTNSRDPTSNYHSIIVHETDVLVTANPVSVETYQGSSVSLKAYPDYRASVKPWWKYYGPFSALDELNKRGLLDDGSAKFLESSVAGRTLGASLDDARQVLTPYMDRHGDLFVSLYIPDLEKRPLKPSRQAVVREIASLSLKHRARVTGLKQRNLLLGHKPLRVLEIGYTSGGTSAFAWEKSGCEAHAIDYFFGDTVESGGRHKYIADMIGSDVQFHVGDVTKKTDLPEEYFDIVFSSSVIEHIADLPAAFEEIKRLLKPGGITMHAYDPYFHPAGGHSLGILDSPWGHVRLSKDEVLDYIRTMRPHEAPVAVPWVQNALYPEHTQAQVQRSVCGAGLRLREWKTAIVGKDVAGQLTEEIVTDVLRSNPGLCVQELLTRKVSFIAQKER
ncbi:class I SAM-dependent methyltransferase [Thioalkalivibrio sp. ALE21]|uniref:methyltransferase domain-containing protein n=1 Tax=Thioalkalivibrio sp. ALE21 TaxID=1158175 RepID=UPI000DA24AE8